ncbi:helix-turn-helix domain-containing protein [Pseudomonas guariconensis]|uniref:helix-turn-helix domain-containing protein n=1 Tax=Pseudomonas guariconensis TaxID=1288410 RepID=UPI0018AC5CED|nr:helix-turn-helix domain-containing protein [Pseudomonas guariconensis]MBF8757746.1 helix-turn-helix domain-containing protein [Pseudomonas guariconensis]
MNLQRRLTPDVDVDQSIHLTPREREVLLWCAYGKTSWEIGQIVGCKESTVNFHVSNILRKFAVNTRVAAVIKAIRYGMLNN